MVTIYQQNEKKKSWKNHEEEAWVWWIPHSGAAAFPTLPQKIEHLSPAVRRGCQAQLCSLGERGERGLHPVFYRAPREGEGKGGISTWENFDELGDEVQILKPLSYFSSTRTQP